MKKSNLILSLSLAGVMPSIQPGKRPQSSGRHGQPAVMDAISYEDLLVAQYLEGLKKESSSAQKKRYRTL